ncbi:BON domain-containing protein [Nonomuraea phyllanthi]|uniref:BON domain-containing protein n=1 Tax=Nonomuraea phyllanthi TaxID=2219224 RepID=A0A5C4WT53_9ACTN|nr:SRPBCC family protein [Nonomuraea phyllanthi]KAB8196760.1 BON domain-containing protein [Nonomuraea phyllanthi]QFY13504.1 BON domain-containing protein [Nonomuraea phyllanthi]
MRTTVYRDTAAEEPRRILPRAVIVGGAGVCAGAAVAYLFDPVAGRARRARARDQAAHQVHGLRDGLGVLSRDLGNRCRGSAAAVRYRFTGGSADDRVLHERVRAELGRYVSHPHGVEVHVQDHVVTLDGDVLAWEDERARRAVQHIPGVRRVQARWRTHRDTAGVPTLQGRRRRREPVPELLQQQWSPTARFAAGTVSAWMWMLSGRLPRPVSWAVRSASVVLAARVATNLPLRRLTGINAGRRAVDVTSAIEIDVPVDAIWSLVSDYSVFSRIMPDVQEVRRSPDGQLSHWVITGPAGAPIRFDATETRREEGKEIAWKTTEGQLIAHTGALRLTEQANGRTRVQVHLTYNPVAGATGHAIARLIGANPARRLQQDLVRLKEHAERERQPAGLGTGTAR